MAKRYNRRRSYSEDIAWKYWETFEKIHFELVIHGNKLNIKNEYTKILRMAER